MPTPKVLFTAGLDFGGVPPAQAMLQEAGFEVVCARTAPGQPQEETREKLEGVDAIIAGADRINDFTLEKAGRLRIVARNGVGYDQVDLQACTERGIVVVNTPGVMADAVADETLGLLLALVRRIPTGSANVKAGQYQVPMGEDLCSMTLGLLGGGRIAAEVIRRALGFKMAVLVHDPWVEESSIRELGATPVSMDQLLSESDAITLHIPFTDDNEKIVNADLLARMKSGSFFINTARGGLVDEEALLEALTTGHIAGAGLDCQATEPPVGISSELVEHERVIAMPHAGSNTVTARREMNLMAGRQVLTMLQGKVPEHVVNPEVLEKLDLK
jgi:phosphoglycerate dehydrogenase-like enzyme